MRQNHHHIPEEASVDKMLISFQSSSFINPKFEPSCEMEDSQETRLPDRHIHFDDHFVYFTALLLILVTTILVNRPIVTMMARAF
jgi:hypothetical protein